MRLFTTISGLRCYLQLYGTQKTVGFVPTMGSLHIGHLSLIQQAKSQNEITIVSIFVNPLQFAPGEDLEKYPRSLEQDRQLCEQAGVDVIFAPTVEELYGQIEGNQEDRQTKMESDSQVLITTVIPPAIMTSGLCGRSRPGHFQGVCTIVTKLLNLVQPTNAYFGEKDAQQLAIIRRLVADLKLPVNIIAVPTVREDSGLAYSSRNQYLTTEQREQAAVLYRSLHQAKLMFQAGERLRISLITSVNTVLATIPDVALEYVELVHPTTLIPLEKVEDKGLLAIAARLGSTRLIDNIMLQNRLPIVAIDGPAGAGKSTVARLVAQALGLLYLDTGAMYRSLTWLVLQSGVRLDDEPAIAELASQAEIRLAVSDEPLAPIQVWINDREVTQAIRTQEVTAKVSAIASLGSVRHHLLKQQQLWGEKGGIVAEGRDIGTHVFPDAELKIFLTASTEERARRRQQDLKNQGQNEVSLEQLERDIAERDRQDSTRTLAPLRKAADAIEVITDNHTIAQVTNHIVTLYNQLCISR